MHGLHTVLANDVGSMQRAETKLLCSGLVHMLSAATCPTLTLRAAGMRCLVALTYLTCPALRVRLPQVADVIGTFRMLAQLPSDSLGAYIISMSHTASDVLAVVLLQQECGGG